jgi:uncharacterized protein
MSTIKKIPMRKCTGCGEMKPKSQLVRVLRSTEGDVVIDLTGKKNGRGAYICNSADCLKKAKKTKAIERSLQTSISEAVYEQLSKELLDEQ